MSRTLRNIPRKTYRYPSCLIQAKNLNIEALDKIKDEGYKLSKNNRVTTKANSKWPWDDFPVSAWDELTVDTSPYDLLEDEDWFIIPYIMNFPNVIYKCRNYLMSKMTEIRDVIDVTYVEGYKVIELDDCFYIFDKDKNVLGKEDKQLNAFNTFRKVVRPDELSQLNTVIEELTDELLEIIGVTFVNETTYRNLSFSLGSNEDLYDVCKDLLIEAEWKLRDITGNKWYLKLD